MTLYPTNFTVPDDAGLLALWDKPLRLFVLVKMCQLPFPLSNVSHGFSRGVSAIVAAK
ncbi:MAG: hypothetical protein ACYTXA_29960 [Nostoc sp.]